MNKRGQNLKKKKQCKKDSLDYMDKVVVFCATVVKFRASKNVKRAICVDRYHTMATSYGKRTPIWD